MWWLCDFARSELRNTQHKGPVMRKGFPCIEAIMSDFWSLTHHSDVIMVAIVSQINSLTIVYSTVNSGADQRKHQSPASLAFVRGIHRGPVNSPHKWPVTQKMFQFDDVFVIMETVLAAVRLTPQCCDPCTAQHQPMKYALSHVFFSHTLWQK